MIFVPYEQKRADLDSIFRITGTNLNSIINSQDHKLMVAQLWKAHCMIEARMKEDRVKKDKRLDELFLEFWNKAILDIQYFIINKPRGFLIEIKKLYDRIFNG